MTRPLSTLTIVSVVVWKQQRSMIVVEHSEHLWIAAAHRQIRQKLSERPHLTLVILWMVLLIFKDV